MHSEGILAGELKHGPLALVDKQMPVIMVIMKDPCFAKCQNALQQVTARQVRALQETDVPALLFHTTRAHLSQGRHPWLLSVGVTTLCPVPFCLHLSFNVEEGQVCAMADAWRSEDNLQE